MFLLLKGSLTGTSQQSTCTVYNVFSTEYIENKTRMQRSLFHQDRVKAGGMFQHVSQQTTGTGSHRSVAVFQHWLQQLIILYTWTQTMYIQ